MYKIPYEELINLKSNYNQADKETIKNNIRQLLKERNFQTKNLSDVLNLSVHTAYSYTKKDYGVKPDLLSLLLIASYFDIDVENLLRSA